jgi:hypothetical protein
MIMFEPLREIEWREDDRLIGVYVPGQSYTCHDDEQHAALVEMIKTWLAEGVIRIVEHTEGTTPAAVAGRGEIE